MGEVKTNPLNLTCFLSPQHTLSVTIIFYFFQMYDEYDLVNLDLSIAIGTTLFRVFSKTVYKLNLYITIIGS
jgi:hypothetical protein